MRRSVLQVVALMSLCGITRSHIEAQALGGIATNARIRVETTNGNLETGRVTAVRGDSVWLRIDHADTVVAYVAAQLRAYELSRGTPHARGARRGALVSGAIGLVAVGVSWYADLSASREEINFPSILFVAPAALVVTLAGTGLGAVLAEERWAAPAAIHVGVGVGGRGLGIAYHVRF